MKKIIFLSLLLLAGWVSAGAVELDKENRDPKYVETIVKRSQKIVDQLEIKNKKVEKEVLHIIANRYFTLNDIYEIRDAKLKEIKASTLTEEARNNAIKIAEDEKDAALYRIHFEYPADLSLFLNDAHINIVKDGMTYGVLKVTYDSYIDMIPTLTGEEKTQIYAWLKEAREFAIDAENSTRKHAFFGKYKGRINNYLAKRGYDLKKEREEWYKRVKANGKSL